MIYLPHMKHFKLDDDHHPPHSFKIKCISWIFIVGILITFPSMVRADDHGTTINELNLVETLVRNWAPLVWLAPGEKFLPGDVKEFFNHVHAEKSKSSSKYAGNEVNNYYYYDADNDELAALVQENKNWEHRNKRNFKARNFLLDYIIDLPIGEDSENWYLVTNKGIGELIENKSSFLYGKNPTVKNVPIYAMVDLCSTPDRSPQNEIESNFVHSIPQVKYKKNPYIPVYFKSPEKQNQANGLVPPQAVPQLVVQPPSASLSPAQQPLASQTQQQVEVTPEIPGDSNNEFNDDEFNQISKVVKRSVPENETLVIIPAEGQQQDNTVDGIQMDETEWTPSIQQNIDEIPQKQPAEVPPVFQKDTPPDENPFLHFHVTYWMFYPYSQGKQMCTLSLGPLGRLPIPLIFGLCLGTRKDFGSHVGDWEHMTLYFKGRAEPEEMYVSAHDAGAYYSYDRLTGTFEFSSQETRKGIIQRPVFPRTVLTSNNHPVLFAAQGSHGLWTAPGKHRFVRVPRLYDINGFGTPWSTWKNVEIVYDNDYLNERSSASSNWLQYRGRWGNPKSKCHPLRRIGLHFCEYSDGPTGIPLKTPHFYCDADNETDEEEE